jgi:hypothetical protein
LSAYEGDVPYFDYNSTLKMGTAHSTNISVKIYLNAWHPIQLIYTLTTIRSSNLTKYSIVSVNKAYQKIIYRNDCGQDGINQESIFISNWLLQHLTFWCIIQLMLYIHVCPPQDSCAN